MSETLSASTPPEAPAPNPFTAELPPSYVGELEQYLAAAEEYDQQGKTIPEADAAFLTSAVQGISVETEVVTEPQTIQGTDEYIPGQTRDNYKFSYTSKDGTTFTEPITEDFAKRLKAYAEAHQPKSEETSTTTHSSEPSKPEEQDTESQSKPGRMSAKDRKDARKVLRGSEDRLTTDQKQKFEAWQQAEKAEGRSGDFDTYKEYTRQGLQQDDELIRGEEAQRVRDEKQGTKRVLHTTEANNTEAHTANTTPSGPKSAENSTAAKTTSTTGTSSSTTTGAASTHNTHTASGGNKIPDNDTSKNNSRNRNSRPPEPTIDAAKMQSIRDLRAEYDEIRSKSRYPDYKALGALEKQLNEVYATLNPEEVKAFAEMKKEAEAAAKKQSQKELDQYLFKLRENKVSLSELAASGYKWKLPAEEIEAKERAAKEALRKQMIGESHPDGRTKRIAKASGRLAMRSMFATGRGVKKVTYTPAVSAKQAVAAKREESKEARFERDQDARERAFQREEMIWYAAAEKAKERRLEESRKRRQFAGGPDGMEVIPGEDEKPNA